MFLKIKIDNIKLIILHFTLFSLLSADASDISWIKIYGKYNLDEVGYSIQQTSDGGFIIAGSIELSKVLLIRTKDDGDTLWTKTYKGQGRYVQLTNDGGFMIVGSTTQGILYLLCTDSNGDSLWAKTYSEDNEGYCLQHTNDSGFIIVSVENKSTNYARLTRVKSNGDRIWTKRYGKVDVDILNYGYSVQQTNDFGFIIGGVNRSYDDFHYNDVLLIKTNSDGDTLWTKRYGGTPTEEMGRSVLQTSDEGFIIVGNTHPHENPGESDIYLIRTNSIGDTLWTKTYGDSGKNDCGYSIQHTTDGGFIIAGFTNTDSGRHDVNLIHTNSNGDVIWRKTFGEYSLDYGYCVQQTDDGGFVIVGKKSEESGLDWNVYIIRTNANGEVNIKNNFYNNLINSSDFIVSNNHGNVTIRYTLTNPSPVKIEAYNIQGKLVKVLQDKFMQQGSYGINWDSKGFGSGVYCIKLSGYGSSVSKKVTIIK